MKGMILAAGLGSRLKPWTDAHPKALAVVNGKSLLQRNIEYFQQYGIKEVVVNVHHFADQIVDAIEQHKGWGSDITISDETDAVLETGGGLIKAAKHLESEEPFVLMNVDILTDLNLNEFIQYHILHKPLATLATRNRETSRYLLFNEHNTLVGWKNIKTGETRPAVIDDKNISARAFSGIHLIDPKLFELVKLQGKFSMIDVYLDLLPGQQIKSFDHSNSRFIDVGKPESIEQAEQMF